MNIIILAMLAFSSPEIEDKMAAEKRIENLISVDLGEQVIIFSIQKKRRPKWEN